MAETRIYLTDSERILKVFRKQLHLELKDGICYRRKNRDTEMFLYIDREELYRGRLPFAKTFAIYSNSPELATFYNAFEPTAEGSAAFQILRETAGLEKSVILSCDVRFFAGEPNRGERCRFSRMENSQTERLKLKRWTESRILQEYMQVLSEKKIYFQDYRVLPLLFEIEKRRREVESAEETRQYFGQFQIGDNFVSAELLDPDGSSKIRTAGNVTGKIVDIQKRVIEEAPPLPYSYSEIIGAAEDAGIQAVTAMEMLDILYELGVITYPKTAEKRIPQDMTDKMLLPLNLAFSPYQGYARKIQYRQLPQTMLKQTEQAGGILLLNTENLEKRYRGQERILLDLLLRRQLALFSQAAKREEAIITIKVSKYHFEARVTTTLQSGWREIAFGEVEEEGCKFQEAQGVILQNMKAEVQFPELHTLHSILVLLKIYAAGNDLEIMDIATALEKSPYIDKIGGYYLLKRSEIKWVLNLPSKIVSMHEINRAYRYVKQKVEQEKLDATKYMNWVNEEIEKVIKEVSDDGKNH